MFGAATVLETLDAESKIFDDELQVSSRRRTIQTPALSLTLC